MNNIIVTRISNGLGNQLFQYAAAYALAKKLKRKLLIDDESAYFKKKDSLRKYELHNFNLSSQIIDEKYKFNIDVTKMQMLAIQYSWYGAGFAENMFFWV